MVGLAAAGFVGSLQDALDKIWESPIPGDAGRSSDASRSR
jgi:hypothetical protein